MSSYIMEMKQYTGTPYFRQLNKMFKDFGFTLLRDKNHYIFVNGEGELRVVPKTPKNPTLTLKLEQKRLSKIFKISN